MLQNVRKNILYNQDALGQKTLYVDTSMQAYI